MSVEKTKITRLIRRTKGGLVLLALSCFSGLNSQIMTQTFVFTGAVQQFTVPNCVASITIEARGAQGSTGSAIGGNGGTAMGVMNVLQGQVFQVYVGGQAGYNGGGLGWTGNGGNGGGASDVRLLPGTLADRIIVGAGGGGGGGTNSGATTAGGGIGGGGTTGPNYSGGTAGYAFSGRMGTNGGISGGTGGVGNGSNNGGSGGGGGFSSGGGGGTSGSLNPGTAGTLGVGGNGGGSGAGGGGGGYYGGGGSSAGNNSNSGGGGGSSYTGTLSAPSFTGGNQTGNGVVYITYELNTIKLAVTAPPSICTGGSATMSVAGASTYTWLPMSSNQTSVVVAPSVLTHYTVSGTTSLGCLLETVITMSVDLAAPSLTVNNTASLSAGICPNQTVNLLATGAVTYTWAGGPSTVTNGITFSPTLAAQYTVTGTNGCGTATAVTSVSVHPIPSVIPLASTPSLCAGSQLTLTASGNAATYTWTGGSVPITDGLGFVPVTSTVYTLTGTSALNCTLAATIPVTVYTIPSQIPAASPPIVCIGGSATLNVGGALNYTWTSATQTVFTPSMVVTPSGTGVTTYTVTKANSNCSDTRTISIITNALPTVVAITIPATVCALSPATLAAGGAFTYTWTAPGTPNYTFTGSSQVISPLQASTYTVAGSDGTCIATSTVFLATSPNPTITISASSPTLCNGSAVTLTASGASNYTWTATSGTFYTASITDSPTVPVAYNVTGDNSFGCTASANQVVLVYNQPTITAVPDKTLTCSGGAVTFSAAGAATYTWDANAGGVTGHSVTVHPQLLSSAAAVYTVTGTNTIGCQGSQTTQVSVFVPVMSVSGNTNACQGGSLQLTASGGNSGSYSWSTGAQAPFPGATLNTSVTAPGVYTVNANTTSLSVTCPASLTVPVGLYPDPVILASAHRTTICLLESVELYASGAPVLLWDNGVTGASITVSPRLPTNYTVTGTDANGCKSTGTVQVRVSTCSGIEEASAVQNLVSVYPNPNKGTFTVRGAGDASLILVNELGQMIRMIELSGPAEHQVEVNGLPGGVYFLSGQKDGKQIHQKILVTD